MTIITIFSDDGRQPFAAVIGTEDAGVCARRMQQIAELATYKYVPAGTGTDVQYIVRAHERQVQELARQQKKR